MNGHIQEEKLAMLAGGDLRDKEAFDLERHLHECPACSARLKSYREDRRSLSALRETGVDERDYDSVRRSVMQRLQTERSFRFRFAQLRWGALAATILIAAVIGIGYWSRIPAPQRVGLPEPVTRPQLEPSQAKPRRPSVSLGEMAATLPTVPRPTKIPRAPQPSVTTGSSPPAMNVPALAVASSQMPQVQDEVIMKLETSDPNVVIIWLASPKGAER